MEHVQIHQLTKFDAKGLNDLLNLNLQLNIGEIGLSPLISTPCVASPLDSHKGALAQPRSFHCS